MTKRQLLTLIAGVSGLGLAACSGSQPDPAPVEKDEGASAPAQGRSAPAPVAAESPPPAEEVPVTNTIVAEVPSEEAAAPDAQMMDDAAATGMTARATRDSPAEAQETPVEQTERE